MNESCNNYEQTFALSDGNAEINTDEQTAIDFVSNAAKRLPEKYLCELIEDIELVLKNKKTEELSVRAACDETLEKIEYALLWDERREDSMGRIRNDILSQWFDATKLNGTRVARYFAYIANNKEEREIFISYLKDTGTLASFLHYWNIQRLPTWHPEAMNPRSNIIQLLRADNPTVVKLEQFYNETLGRFNFTLDPGESTASILKKLEKTETEGKTFDISKIKVVKESDGTFRNSSKEATDRNFNIFIESSKTISSYSNQQIGDILSYVYAHSDQGSFRFHGNKNPNAKRFLEKMAGDPAGIVHLAQNWSKWENAIANKLQFKWVAVQELVSSILKEIGNSLESSIGNYLTSHYLSEEETRDAKNRIQEKLSLAPKQSQPFDFLYTEIGKILESKGCTVKKENQARFINEILVKDYAQARLLAEARKNTYPNIHVALNKSGTKEEKTGRIVELRKRYTNDPVALAYIDAREKENGLEKYVNSETSKAISNIPANDITQEGKVVIEAIAKTVETGNHSAREAISASFNVQIEVKWKIEAATEKLGLDYETIIQSESLRRETIERLRNKKQRNKEEISLLTSLEQYEKSLSNMKREYTKIILNIDDAELKKRGIDTNKIDLSKNEKELRSYLENKTVGDPKQTEARTLSDLGSIPVGTSKYLSLNEENNQGNTTLAIEVTREQYSYTVKIGDKPPVQLADTEYDAYIQSIDLLEKTGLSPLLQYLSPTELRDMFRATSRGDSRVNNQDGSWSQAEQVQFLKTMARLLGIKSIENAIAVPDMIEHFRRYTAQNDTKNIFAQWKKADGSMDTKQLIEQVTRI